MTFKASRSIEVNDVLEYLSSRTQVPSSLGSQLEELKYGTSGTGGGGGDAEQAMLNRANLATCVAELEKQQHVKFACTDILPQFARKIRARPGAVAVAVVRAYQPWHCDPDANRPAGSEKIGVIRGPDRGLAEVYDWMREIDTSQKPVTGVPTAELFRDGLAKQAKILAAQMLADAEIVVTEWVTLWNRKGGYAASHFLSVAEFSDRYGVPERSVQRWCKEGKLDAISVSSVGRAGRGEEYKIDVRDLVYDPEAPTDQVDVHANGMTIVSGK